LVIIADDFKCLVVRLLSAKRQEEEEEENEKGR